MPSSSILIAAATPQPEQIREALDRSYRGIQADRGFWERAVAAGLNALGALLEFLGRALTGEGVSVVVTIVLWLLIGIVAVLAAIGLSRVRVGRRTRRAPAAEQIDWHALADEAVKAGDDREAVRALYRALVAALSRRGVVEDVPSLTAGQCRRLVRKSLTDAAPSVDEATGIYERVTYGLGDFGERELAHMREAERRVLAR